MLRANRHSNVNLQKCLAQWVSFFNKANVRFSNSLFCFFISAAKTRFPAHTSGVPASARAVSGKQISKAIKPKARGNRFMI